MISADTAHAVPAIEFKLLGPCALCSENDDVLADCEFREETGIYVWAAKQRTGQYRVTYIGETGTSFYARMKEHVIQTLGGNYRVIAVDDAANGIETVLWDGLWRRGTRQRLPDFLSRYEFFAAAIKRYLLSQAIFVAPLQCDARLRKRIEGALARELRTDAVASSLLPTDIRFVQCRADERSVRVVVSAPVQIDGMPTGFIA